MKTFNLLGGQIVIDESKDKYHELKVVGENIRREIFWQHRTKPLQKDTKSGIIKI